MNIPTSTETHPRRICGWSQRKTVFRWLKLAALTLNFYSLPNLALAQSPELAMRDFSSGQIKKGVRSIGFGGDGATWGNYGLVWVDASTVLADYGDTNYSNGNEFHFEAVGFTSPSLWHRLAIYVIAMSQGTNNVRLNVKSTGLGPAPVPVVGTGSDFAVFSKIAMPLGKGVSVGVLLAHETSRFDAGEQQDPKLRVVYQTDWRPSGGFGVAWQPYKRLLFGFRGLLNNDLERRTDPTTAAQGRAHSAEYRFGVSGSPWNGALLDVGATRLERRNNLNATHSLVYHPNLGFEQALLQKRFTFRFGLDETSPTAGVTFKHNRFKLDAAYVRDMARARVGNLFGTDSNSLLVTFTLDYARKHAHDSAKPANGSATDQQAGFLPSGIRD